MPRNRGVSLIAIGALIGAGLVPLGATGATAATLQPSGIVTGMQLDGDKTGGTPPNTFDWDSFLSAPVPDGSFTFTPTGAYTTSQGYQSTGILDATFSWDNGTLAAACGPGQDASGSPGSQTPNSNPWVPGPANVNDKGNLCSTGTAYEVVTDGDGVRHAILYNYWTRLVGNGDMSALQLLEGPLPGRCDDILVDFDYESNTETLVVSFRTWTPNAGDGCANPNGAGQWVVTGTPIDFDWGVGVRSEGPALGNQPQATFAEFAVDLTTAGLFSPDSCDTFTASTMISRTGNAFNAQTQDYTTPVDPLVISNCGTLTVTKLVDPEGYEGDDTFGYVVNRAGGGIVLPEAGDATQISDSLGIGETDVWENVTGAGDYRLTETVEAPWEQVSIICTAEAPGTGEAMQWVLDSPDDTFTVYGQTTTDCVITNATSTVTVTKQTLPDGSTADFAFDIGGNAATLSDGESATFTFTPGTTVDISETIPAGWLDSAEITCSDNANASIGVNSATVTTVAGEDVSCVFTNTQLGTIRVSKEAFGTDDNLEFLFNGSWLGEDDEFSILVETGDGENYYAEFPGIAPGTYTVSEEEGQHGTLFGSLLCTVGGQDIDFNEPSAEFELAPGDTVTCYFVNVSPGQILVIKQTDPFEYDQNFPFTFAPAEGEATEFTLNPLPGQATFSSGPVGPGEYVITELVGEVPSWSLTDVTCEVSGEGSFTADLEAGTATVDLPADGVAECIFTNTADPATLSLEKTVTGVADGYAWSFDFQLIDEDSGDVQTLTVTSESPSIEGVELVPGTNYTLIEVAQAGWSGTLTCDVADADTEADGWQFSLEPGAAIECEADNDATPASVTVQKTVTGVAPGFEWGFDFTLDPAEGVTPGATQTVSGAGATSASATWEGLLPGETYTLTEDAVTGWTAGDLTCVGVEDLDDAADSVTFVATPGLVLSCTITNTPDPIDLEIVKTAIGGDATFQWVLTPITPPSPALVASVVTEGGTGVASFEGLVAGTVYSLTELEQDGWINGELSCVVTHADESTEDLDVTGFTVLPGDQIACEIENQAYGTIVIVKNVEGPDGTFDFTGTWLDPEDFSITTTEGTGSETFENVTPGSYEVSETAPVGFDGVVVCVDGDEAGTASGAEGLLGLIELDPGETVVCTFTNTEWGTILVDKKTLPAGSDQVFDFEWGPEGEAFTLTDEAEPFSTGLLAPGEYTVTETSELPRWFLTGLDCVGGDEPIIDLEGRSATFALPLQATVYCTFENAYLSPLVIDKVITTEPEEQADGTYIIDYLVTVTNPGGLADTYDLDDELMYGTGVTVNTASVASLNGVPVNAGWDGLGDLRVATGVEIDPGVTHSYSVVVNFSVATGIAPAQADCTTGSDTEGTGTLNRATVTFTDGDDSADACAPVPSKLPPTGVTLTALWLGLGLLLAGAVVILLRRRSHLQKAAIEG